MSYGRNRTPKCMRFVTASWKQTIFNSVCAITLTCCTRKSSLNSWNFIKTYGRLSQKKTANEHTYHTPHNQQVSGGGKNAQCVEFFIFEMFAVFVRPAADKNKLKKRSRSHILPQQCFCRSANFAVFFSHICLRNLKADLGKSKFKMRWIWMRVQKVNY